jgi:acyl carrier protein
MSTVTIADKVRHYLLESFLADRTPAGLRDDDDLLQVLDSLQVLRMVIALEGMFAVKVEQGELNPDNLGSVQKIAAFIARKRGWTQSLSSVLRTVSNARVGEKSKVGWHGHPTPEPGTPPHRP